MGHIPPTNSTRYLICTTPRTGSNWFCDMMARTGIAGINDVNRAGFFIGNGSNVAGQWRERIPDYLASVQTPNGVQGTKAMLSGFDDIMRWGVPSHVIDELLHSFTHYIFLYRDNTLKQAVSWYYALQTQEFRWDANRPPKPALPQYNRHRIAHYIAMIQGENARWLAWLKEYGITPYYLKYEDLARDYTYYMDQVLTWLGLTPPANGYQTTFKVQKSPEKSMWIERYRMESGRT